MTLLVKQLAILWLAAARGAATLAIQAIAETEEVGEPAWYDEPMAVREGCLDDEE